MIFYLIILIIGIPIGFLIAWLARDELIEGFVYIKALALASFIGALIFYENEVITLGLGFVCVVSYISVLKRFDNKWATERKR